MSALEAEVPAEPFRNRQCTFLELFQVPGTPIFLKICRELGGHVGDTTGRLSSQGEATGHFCKKELAGRSVFQKGNGWPARKGGRPAICPNPRAVWSFHLLSSSSLIPRLGAYIMQPRSSPLLPPTTLSSPDLSSIRVFQRPTQVVFAKIFSFKHFEVIKFRFRSFFSHFRHLR